MFKIRKNIFETNSSSTHSLVITDNNLNNKWTSEEALEQLKELGATVDKSKNYDILNLATIKSNLWEFNRSYEAYNDFAIKLIYSLVSYKNNSIIFNGIIEHIKIFLKVSEVIIPTQINEYTGNIELIGDIDHDSINNLPSKINSNLSLNDYLLNKDIYLIIDNEG